MIELHNGATAERCFLCDPPRDLLFFESADFLALAGLGPVVEGYSVVAAKAHIKSMADVPGHWQPQRDALARTLRDRLTQRYGCCLMTEHGRMQVCTDGDHDAHCFHAHFLMFPGARDVSEIAQTYFAEMETFNELGAALSQAALHEEYVLISPTPDRFNILYDSLNAPRQLARYLVAHDSNALHLADWRDHPDRERARTIGLELRSLFASELPC